MKNKFAIVLVSPRGDANIGAAARAMKNFGILDLRLVDAANHLTKESYMWAVEARDILENAKTFQTLDAALCDMPCAVAFTRRIGKLRRKHMDIKEAGAWLVKKAGAGGAALVFGREDSGLSNDEIGRCDTVVTIPTSARLPSLNLAQAVIIACHEIFRCSKTKGGPSPGGYSHASGARQEFVPKKDIRVILNRMGKTLSALGYNDEPNRRVMAKILAQFEKLFGRGGLTARDVRMFEGLLARITEKTANPTPKNA